MRKSLVVDSILSNRVAIVQYPKSTPASGGAGVEGMGEGCGPRYVVE